MLAWMIYAVLVAIPLSAAALVAEKAARVRRLPTRWPWIMAIVASLLVPILITTVSIRVPDLEKPAATAAAFTLRDTTSVPLTSRVIDWSGAQPYTSSVQVNAVLRGVWQAISITLVVFLGLSTAWFYRRKRSWRAAHVCGVPVLVSDNVGPAVVGLLRSRIVVPAWVLEESPEQQRYVMAHEQSHLNARDPLLVATALTLLVATPWIPLLWWQFHRLRCAIEVDCDARVLGDDGNLRDYCETLIQVGQNQSGYVGAVTAMSESRSFLERRIRIMLSKPQKWARASAVALIGISLGMAAFATQVTPPAAQGAISKADVAVSPDLLDAYVGSYEISDLSLVTVARKGDGLTVSPIGQMTAQGTIDAPAISDTVFAVPPVDATTEFVKGADHQVKSMIIRVHGALYSNAPRVDQATADHIRESLAARVRNQVPFPDSEKALRIVLDNSGSPAGIRPESVPSAELHESLNKYYAALGPVQSFRFNGVTDYGWDSYDVQHKNGAEQVFFLLDDHGLIVSSVVRRQ
jgi:beta-lactamase regulating signal transducer with metallopeptidase domain